MEIINRYFPELNPRQLQQLEELEALYTHWNAQINVISRKDLEELYVRHVLHSLAIAKVQTFRAGQEILDVGTGGGFPGVPLAILFPETQFTLVDSIGKKIKVVQEVSAALGLDNVEAIQMRAENVPGKFHYVVSRAVTQMPVFADWVKGKFHTQYVPGDLPNGILYLKGGDLREELSIFSEAKEFDIPQYFSEDFFETKKVVFVPARSLSKALRK
ncbi:MAG: 16S rRNA (guanine(527)-N(7))-methyltransferase RsmG [Weeksellaceae bacterium]|nr:16S rRNA (guanine(527)-N(7))-methyltransferase RsmG [Weeksellaceae bacterium]